MVVMPLQVTLVDCPGHATLIRTVIGGAQIIDMMMLVVDITKGIQVGWLLKCTWILLIYAHAHDHIQWVCNVHADLAA